MARPLFEGHLARVPPSEMPSGIFAVAPSKANSSRRSWLIDGTKIQPDEQPGNGVVYFDIHIKMGVGTGGGKYQRRSANKRTAVTPFQAEASVEPTPAPLGHEWRGRKHRGIHSGLRRTTALGQA
jgi:hypothetical protein